MSQTLNLNAGRLARIDRKVAAARAFYANAAEELGLAPHQKDILLDVVEAEVRGGRLVVSMPRQSRQPRPFLGTVIEEGTR
jgi:predicted ATPase